MAAAHEGQTAATLEIYRASIEEERRLLIDAMRDGVSSKPPTEDGAGLGLWKAANATSDLDEIMLVRSGRLQISRCDLLQPAEWLPESRGYHVGTAVSVLWPWRELSDPAD